VRPKSDALCFAIHHYAGRVVYQAETFMDKNRNFLPPEVIQLLRQSHRDMVRFLFQCPLTKTGNLYSPSQESPRSTPEGSKVRLILWTRMLLEKLIAVELGKKFPAFCETQNSVSCSQEPTEPNPELFDSPSHTNTIIS
jgi:hypothetical protein